jgi:hypothetical protein
MRLIRGKLGLDGDGEYCIIEPFLAQWLQREQRDYGLGRRIQAGD